MGMMKKVQTAVSALLTNKQCFDFYYDRIKELTLTMFKWEGLPEEIDGRFLELILFENGKAVFFKDDVTGKYLITKVTDAGQYDIYNIPLKRRGFANNGYNRKLTKADSVMIYNNVIRTSSDSDCILFATRLAQFDKVIDVNINAQKTPVLIRCDERERLAIKNLYKQYDGNEPVIFGDKNLSAKPLECIRTDAPFIADSVYELKVKYWNEMLTFKGISNMSFSKKERLITDEVIRSQGGTIASRYSGLEMRQKACEEINRMFGLNVSCSYRLEDDGQPLQDTDSEVFADE